MPARTPAQERWLQFFNRVVYTTMAPAYDAMDWLTLGTWWRLLRRALEYVPAGMRVLEVGFGPGKLHTGMDRRNRNFIQRGWCREYRNVQKRETVQINKLTFIGLYLNGALGSGKYDDINIDEVKEEIQNHTVFDYLHRKLGEDIDLGLLTPEDKRMLNKEWEFLADYVDEKRRMSVSKNGLCLLVAYVLEGIRARSMQGGGVQPNAPV